MIEDQVQQLIAQWRAEADKLDDGTGGHSSCSSSAWRIRQCADGLEALLAERPLPTIEEASGLLDDPTGGIGIGPYLDDLRGVVERPPPQEALLTADDYALLASIMTDHAADASESEDVDRNAEAPMLHALAQKLGRLVPVGYLPKPLGSPTP